MVCFENLTFIYILQQVKTGHQAQTLCVNIWKLCNYVHLVLVQPSLPWQYSFLVKFNLKHGKKKNVHHLQVQFRNSCLKARMYFMTSTFMTQMCALHLWSHVWTVQTGGCMVSFETFVCIGFSLIS